MSRPSALALPLAVAVAVAVAGCGEGELQEDAPDLSAPSGGVPAVRVFVPDVPTWRGGCFLSGPPGKVVNGSPSSDVRFFGDPCGDPPGAGGLVFLDRFDPVAGGGDVTVLRAAAGAAPVVVARNGGSGAAVPESTGARFDEGQRRLAALADVGFVTGTLVVADLPAGTPVRTVAGSVRVENYDFVAGGGVLYVGAYDATTREGDLVHWDGTGSVLLASRASRFDFVMYRLSPDRARVAYLRGWTSAAGGDLYVQALPPDPGAPPPAPLASGVLAMDWTADGRRLAYRTVGPDAVGAVAWVWDGSGAPRRVADDVHAAELVANDLLVATGWSVLSQRVGYDLLPGAGGPPLLAGAGPGSVEHAVAHPEGTAGVLVYAQLAPTGDWATGDLVAAPLAGGTPIVLDRGVSAGGGFGLSPRASYVSYTLGFARPLAPGSAAPQPGLAAELRIAPSTGGAPWLLAHDAPSWVAWDPREGAVVGLDAFEPAANAGTLLARALPGGEALLSLARVGLGRSGFADDGSLLWALRGWDDALQRGELVLAATGGGAAWQPVLVDANVTAVTAATGGRALYCVRGGARDGLWLGAVP